MTDDADVQTLTEPPASLGQALGNRRRPPSMRADGGADPEERLGELLREVQRHRNSIREFGWAGYVTMVEQHQLKLREVHDLIRRHCQEHGLDLPRGVPGR